jgi:hypothetical protein
VPLFRDDEGELRLVLVVRGALGRHGHERKGGGAGGQRANERPPLSVVPLAPKIVNELAAGETTNG